jgi:hypothetical protein
MKKKLKETGAGFALLATAGLFCCNIITQVAAQRPEREPRDRDRSDVSSAQKGRAKVEVVLERLECDDTTESGADEVYILAAGKKSDGSVFSQRWPSNNPHQASGHWDMNDSGDAANNPSGDSRHITNKTLFVNYLNPGESWDIIFAFMEEDLGSTGEDALPGLAKALQTTPNAYAIAAGTFLQFLTDLGIMKVNVDSDDYIGSMALHVTNDGGKIVTEWREVDRVSKLPFKNAFEFDMTGDDSIYKAWIYTQ